MNHDLHDLTLSPRQVECTFKFGAQGASVKNRVSHLTQKRDHRHRSGGTQSTTKQRIRKHIIDAE